MYTVKKIWRCEFFYTSELYIHTVPAGYAIIDTDDKPVVRRNAKGTVNAYVYGYKYIAQMEADRFNEVGFKGTEVKISTSTTEARATA